MTYTWPILDKQDNPGKVKFVTQLGIFIIQLFLCNWPPDLLRSKVEQVTSSLDEDCASERKNSTVNGMNSENNV